MKIWSMTKKDLAIFFRDRSAWVWLFILPLVFILIFAGLGGFSTSSSPATDDPRTPLAVVNQDADGALAARFIEDLGRSSGYRAVLYSQKDAEEAANLLKLGYYLVIPPNFSADLSQARPVTLTLMVHPNASVDGAQSLLQAVNGVARDTSLELQLLDGIRQMGAMQGEAAFSAERVLAQAKTQFERSRQTPLISIAQVIPRVQVTATDEYDLGKGIVPGMTVLFVFLAAQGVARGIFEERQSGSLRRLLSAPITRTQIMAGKLLPILLLVLIQIAYIFSAGALILPLLGFGRLGIGRDPLAWGMTSLVIALCSTALGVMISSLAKTEAQVSGLSNALLWAAGFLGGTMMPPFILQTIPILSTLMRLVPQYWATTAYYDILARGKNLAEVLPSLGILLAFAAVFFFIGVRKFRFE